MLGYDIKVSTDFCSTRYYYPYLVGMIVGKQIAAGRIVITPAASDVSLLAEKRKAGHGNEDSLGVNAPQVHQKNKLQFYVSLEET